MTSYAWLRASGLPLGPFAQPFTLQARFRGRRLHVSTTCRQYQQMNPNRGAFEVTVDLGALEPDRHLCHQCVHHLEQVLQDRRRPGGYQRADYLSSAWSIDQARIQLGRQRTRIATESQDGKAVPHPDVLKTIHYTIAGLHRIRKSVEASGGTMLALLDPIVACLAEADAVIAALRTAWDSPQGRHAQQRVAAIATGGQPGNYRGLRFPTKDAEGARRDLAKPHWAVGAVNAAYNYWRSATAAGQPATVAAARAQAAATEHARTSGAMSFDGIPAVRTPNPGETLTDYVQDHVRAYAHQVVMRYIEEWESDIASRLGADPDRVVLAVRPTGTGNVAIGLSPCRAVVDEQEVLAVPLAVARLLNLRHIDDPEALTASPAVLATVLRLAADGTWDLQGAWNAARMVHHDAPAPAAVTA